MYLSKHENVDVGDVIFNQSINQSINHPMFTELMQRGCCMNMHAVTYKEVRKRRNTTVAQ